TGMASPTVFGAKAMNARSARPIYPFSLNQSFTETGPHNRWWGTCLIAPQGLLWVKSGQVIRAAASAAITRLVFMVYLLWCLVGSPLGLDGDAGRGTSVPAAPTRPGSTGHLLWDGKDDATPIVLFQRGLLKQQGGVTRWTSYAQRGSPLTPTIAR